MWLESCTFLIDAVSMYVAIHTHVFIPAVAHDTQTEDLTIALVLMGSTYVKLCYISNHAP